MAQMQVESNGSFNNQSRIPVMKKGITNQNTQSSTGGSRLEKMQHQFQKKLVKEKEEKMIQMYENNQQRTINKVIRNSGKGLVRDFFRERRALEKMTQGVQDAYVPPIDVHFQQKKQQIITETDTNNKKQQNTQIPLQRRPLQKHSAGRDRSYPLAPIERQNAKGQNHTSPSSKTEQMSRLQQPQTKRYSGSGIPSYQKFQINDKSTIKNAQPHYIDDFEDNSDDDDSANESGSSDEENEPVINSKMPNHRIANQKQEEELQRLEKEIEEEEEKLRQEQEIQLQLIKEKEKGKMQNHHINEKQHNLKIKDNPPTAIASNPVNLEQLEDQYDSEKDDQDEKIHERMPTPEGLASCPICGRHFALDRIEKHSKVCEKTSKTKRKVFDPVKMRTQGTEMEQFRRKTNKNSEQVPTSKKGNWRSKHESFIESIRQARTVQKHLASGGKLSDLPPPPPSENPDYIQCPHCQRRFNSDAAERHIPKCQNIGTKPPPATKIASKNSKITKIGSSKHK